VLRSLALAAVAAASLALAAPALAGRCRFDSATGLLRVRLQSTDQRLGIGPSGDLELFVPGDDVDCHATASQVSLISLRAGPEMAGVALALSVPELEGPLPIPMHLHMGVGGSLDLSYPAPAVPHVTIGRSAIDLNGDGKPDITLHGVDEVRVDAFAPGAVITAEGGRGAPGPFQGSLTAFGGPGGSTLIGGPGDDVLVGGSGDDTIRGGAGDDRITGGAGSDVINAGQGDDLIFPGAGSTPDGVIDRVQGGAGDDTVTGADPSDVIHGVEHVG
jgi:hypothetical protein